MSGPGRPPNYKKFEVITLLALCSEPEDPPHTFKVWAAWDHHIEGWIGWFDRSWIGRVPATTWLAAFFKRVEET